MADKAAEVKTSRETELAKRASVRARFKAEGVSIVDWARRHGFEDRAVHAVLAGKTKCNRGASHRIAVALGLKQEPETFRFRADKAV